MVREDVVKKVKTVPRHVYLVHLGVPRLPEPDEPLVEVRSVGPGHVERLVAVDVLLYLEGFSPVLSPTEPSCSPVG